MNGKARAVPLVKNVGYKAVTRHEDGTVVSLHDDKFVYSADAPVQATCEAEYHRIADLGPVPAPQCSCGVYGLYSVYEAVSYVRMSPENFVVRIDIGGRVILAENGFRSEYALITGVIDDDQGYDREPIAEELKVPLLDMEEEYMLMYGGDKWLAMVRDLQKGSAISTQLTS